MSFEASSFVSLQHLLSTPRSERSPVAFHQEQQIDWQQFQSDVAQLSDYLAQQSSKRIALCFGDSYLFSVTFFAACHANKTLVLPGNYQPEAVKELTPHFDLLLHDSEITVADGVQAFQVDYYEKRLELQALSWSELDLDNIKLTLFTSGSSGKAKAIEKSLLQIDLELHILQSLWGERLVGSRIESTVSHQHIYGLLFRVLWPLCAARSFAIHNLEFPEQLVHHADESTVLISSPALLKRLTEEHKPTPLRCLFSSGGPLPNNAAIHSQTLFSQLPIEVFGSTETGGIAHRQQVTAQTPWRLFPTVKAQLNQENCLRLNAPHIAGESWYQTADECYFHDDVSFELKGRTDRVVKIEEKRISLVEVEQRLEQLAWIEESCVIPIMEGNRLSLCAVIVVNSHGQQQMTIEGKGKFWLTLRKELRNWLEPIAIPRKYRVVDEIPLNSQGKRLVADIEQLFQ